MLIDGVDVDIDKEEEKLKILFNREFTFGHLFNINDSNLLNTKSPNHQGKTIGKGSTEHQPLHWFNKRDCLDIDTPT